MNSYDVIHKFTPLMMAVGGLILNHKKLLKSTRFAENARKKRPTFVSKF